MVEINRNETLDQLIKGSILEPCGVVGTTFPNDVSIYYFKKEFCILPFILIWSFFTFQLTDFLFGSPEKPKLDLLALNIQRGRDHGIQGYVNYLKICSGNKNKHSMTFDDLILRQYLTQEVITLSISYTSDDASGMYVLIFLKNPVVKWD